MKIAVDAMGGDYAPEALVEGVLLAIPQCPADLLLVGNEARLREILSRDKRASSVEVVHAPETIGMGEAGPMAIRRKREASLSVAMRFLAEGKVDAVVSAGNSSAIVATARHFVGLVPGLRRPAMAVHLPTLTGGVLLVDVGAHAESSSIHLAQSAALAHAYLKVTNRLDHPRIGLLNIGHEPIKGTRIVQRAAALMKRTSLCFIGNVEPQGLFFDRTDIAVCDGFVGNVVLKLYEGLSDNLLRFLEARLDAKRESPEGGLRRIVDQVREIYDYQSVGGAPLLGVQKPVIVAHGHSLGPAIANATLFASRIAEDRVFEHLGEDLERDSILTELKHHNAMLVLESFKNKWGRKRTDS
jgi:glycerol-3-phosphate acyltransferase PlsX